MSSTPRFCSLVKTPSQNLALLFSDSHIPSGVFLPLRSLHELLLKVFDAIEAFHATNHLFSQFVDVGLVSHCLFPC